MVSIVSIESLSLTISHRVIRRVSHLSNPCLMTEGFEQFPLKALALISENFFWPPIVGYKLINEHFNYSSCSLIMSDISFGIPCKVVSNN